MYMSSHLPFFTTERNPARITPATKRKKRRRVTGSSPDRSVRYSNSLQVLPETNDNGTEIHFSSRRHYPVKN